MKPTRLVPLLLSALLVLVSLGSAPAAAQTNEAQGRNRDRPARVLSFNIHHGQGLDGNLDLQRIADVIATSEADIVGLQEVDNNWSRSDFVDQTKWLAKTLGMHAVFGSNLELEPEVPGEGVRQYGTAILTDRPILEWDNTLLPLINGEQRGLLRARVAVRGVPVQVYNTHLEHSSVEERSAQITAIKEMIGTPKDSVVLTGDMNATPDAPEIADLVDGLIDTWEAGGAGEGHTYPVEDPSKRIDYVLSSDDVVTRTAAVIATEASDHLPVAADVLLPGDKVGVGRPR